MKTDIPPPLAIWLLKRFLTGERRESLLGDLIEEHHRRRSRTWFWSETLMTLLRGAWSDLGQHKLRGLGAVLTGSAAFIGAVGLVFPLAMGVFGKVLPVSWWFYEAGYPRGIEFVTLLLMCGGSLFSGWVVARVHPTHRSAMLLAYFGSFLVYAVALLALMPQRMPYGSYAFNVAGWMIAVALYSSSILIGGALGSSERYADRTSDEPSRTRESDIS